MNGIRKSFFGGVLYIGLLSGCAKDINQFTPAPVTDTAWVQQVSAGSALARLSDTLRLSPLTDTIQIPSFDTLSLGGMQLLLSGATWTGVNGASYTGAAQVHALLVVKRGDWIREFLSTTCGAQLIQAGAAIFLSVTSGGDTLMSEGSLTITIPLQSVVDIEGVWSGTYTPYFLQWTAPASGATVADSPTSWSLTTPATGWLLCGQAYTGDTTASAAVILPNSFSNDNSAVFCLLPAVNILVALKGDPASRTFTTQGLPAGTYATFFSLTYTGNAYYLGVKTVTLQSGTTTVTLSPTLQPLSSLVSYLEQL
jgi:hypothetical protein